MDRRIRIIQGDITKLDIDAIVNAANNSLSGGGGVDGAIHRAAGSEFTKACFALKGCKTGEAKIVDGYNLPVKKVILTVGPVWNNGTNNEEFLLQSCHINSLKLAVRNGIKTIAFPSISTGAYRFPFELASTIALESIGSFLNANSFLEEVVLVAYSKKDYDRIKKIYNKLNLET